MTFSISVLRVHLTRAILLSLTLAINGCGGGGSSSDLPPLSTASDELKEPKVLSSSGGQLDVLMVAHAASVNAFSPYQTTGWVYSICYRPSDGSNQCPSDGSQDNDYGGTRLQINPGDKLKVHLINQLPTAADAKHAQDDGEAFLALNPTNLHTHGLLVSPFYPSQGSSVWGDNVFVYAFNSNNGTPAASQHLHGTVQYDAVDYEYDVPSGHPSGLYWFHPHVHGISGNQITAGLSGLITVGQVADYACQSATCASGLSSVPVRHLMLKDSQVEHNGTLSHDQDSAFCTVDASVGSSSPTHQGGCDGQNQTANGGNDHTGGRWFFTVNGQQFPTVTVGAPSGQIWRITNSSKSATYELNLWQPDEHREMLMKVLSIDGVSIDNADSTSANQVVDVSGNKFQPLPCQGGASLTGGVCTTRLHLMPSSRAEVWVTYRDANGMPVAPPTGARAVFRTNGYQTGPTGDNWPAVDLAKVSFGVGNVSVTSVSSASWSPSSWLLFQTIAGALQSRNQAVATDPSCTPLAAGHKRRIFFNVPSDNPNAFGLGYEEVDENDVPVPGTFQDVKPFDPSTPTVCVAMASSSQPTVERWELVNLAGEDHNFHIHQIHFHVLSNAEVASTALPDQLTGHGVLMDSLPLAHADGTCNTVDDWRQGHCTAHMATVEIPFAIAGDFVYHCHILEHEDGGMMAIIHVRPTGSTSIAQAWFNKLKVALGLASRPAQANHFAQIDQQICSSRTPLPHSKALIQIPAMRSMPIAANQ